MATIRFPLTQAPADPNPPLFSDEWREMRRRAMADFVPSPARLYDPVTGLLVAAEGQPVDPERIPHLITEERLHARQRGEVPLEEPTPTTHKATRAKTRARKPGENRAVS